jgi:hypothetical protein
MQGGLKSVAKKCGINAYQLTPNSEYYYIALT